MSDKGDTFGEINNQTDDFVEFVEPIDDVSLCSECHIYYKVKDDKCTYCAANIFKCILCKEFYTAPNEQHCSGCKCKLEYEGKEVSLDEIIAMPRCAFKSAMINNHLVDFFEKYKVETNQTDAILVKTQPMLTNIINVCKGKPSGEVLAILDGLRDMPKIFLYAKDAEKLLAAVIEAAKNVSKTVKEHDKYLYEDYKYIHAIAPYILDVWNTTDTNGVLACYYKDTGSLQSSVHPMLVNYMIYGIDRFTY